MAAIRLEKVCQSAVYDAKLWQNSPQFWSVNGDSGFFSGSRGRNN
jgi:hypothetical protein